MPSPRPKARKSPSKSRAIWVRTTANVAPKAAVQQAVETRGREVIDTVFKVKHLPPPPENPRFNYVVDIIGRWNRGFYYFVSIYACPQPGTLSPTFEAPFTRLRHKAGGTFGLAYMRHTGQWFELYPALTLDEAFVTIREEMHFWPLT